MILKNGVTGCTGGDLSLEFDWEARIVEFKRYCYVFVQQLKGEILEWYEPDVDVSYARAHIKINENELYIFHNGRYDYIAFSNDSLITGLHFIDHHLLKTLFETRYEVLTVKQLEEPLVRQAKDSGKIILNDDDANDIIQQDDYCNNYILLNGNELNDIELSLVNYYWSRTVGDLVFNYWD